MTIGVPDYLNNIIIKLAGDHENHVENPCSKPVIKFYENSKQEIAHNRTNSHNIVTQNFIDILDEVPTL
ncbi:unnamed protein product [Didymodactylos carnosus]|uniref:PXA domain-containing protein n=1 Tax=Didymodactylos carnosus TaxID=1234261 RepID=A0A8S2E6U6_9BILA|nr:unnamed protein product [Didymodactylos carnosus]CAF3843171.1 unnamed protein product [Didymodactylos carnosus]